MASIYSQFGLSEQTRDAWRRYGPHFARYGTGQHSTEQRCRREFYLTYLEDVVPDGVSVHHIPTHHQPWDLGGSYTPRDEIQLWYAGKIFMTGVIGVGKNPTSIEQTAGTLAFTYWGRHDSVPYRHQAWVIFTGLEKIRFCSSRDGREWVRTATFHPINEVREVVTYFQEEVEKIRRG